MNLATIQHVFNHRGPFVSVYVDVSRNTEDAASQLDARLTTLRHDLEHEGVAEELIEELCTRIGARTDIAGEARRLVIASGDEIVFDDVRAGHTTWPESHSVGPLPDLAGWLHQVDGQLPFVLVTADREGADIDVYQATSKPDATHTEVHGETQHIQKVPQGDWAQKQFQQRSENVWQHNAREVADAVRSATSQHRPRVVVLAGDERARTEIASALEHLPTEVEQVRAGGRAAGSSTESLWSEVKEVLAHVEAHDEQAVTERLLEKSGQGEGAARGLPDVLDALVQGRVERLIVDLQAAREQTVTPSEHPGLSLPESAAGEKELPADQVLVAAGAATDCELSVLPADLTKGAGVAALLRWTT